MLTLDKNEKIAQSDPITFYT